jgi:ATP-dependent Clp protease protease subunit
VEIQARELMRWKKVLTNIYVEHTKKSYAELESDMERDCFMTASESVTYGLADQIIEKRSK